MALDIKRIILDLKNANILEINELVENIEKTFNVSSNIVNFNQNISKDNINNSENNEKTEFDLQLLKVGNQKVKVIKLVRDKTGLGLKESKELVDKIPSIIKKGISKDEVNELKDLFIKLGAEVKII